MPETHGESRRSVRVRGLPDLPHHDRRQDDAGVDRPDKSALFSANEVDIRSISHRAYQHNKKDTIGRKCHRCNARPGCAFPQRYFADRETLSRVLQSALIAGQGTHTVQEASHGHSSCAGSEDPVWTWSRWTGLARASERTMSGRRRSQAGRGHDFLGCDRPRTIGVPEIDQRS